MENMTQPNPGEQPEEIKENVPTVEQILSESAQQDAGIPPVNARPEPAANMQEPSPKSYFDGNTLQLIGWQLLGFLLGAVTFGLAIPWAECMIYRWETKHTVVEGKRLYFDGKGHQLLGRYLLWWLLTVITLGIYAIFRPVSFRKWRVEHTRFATAEEAAKVGKLSGWQMATAIFGAIAAVAILAMLVMSLVSSGVLANIQPDRIIPDLVENAQGFLSNMGTKEPNELELPEGGYYMGAYDPDNGSFIIHIQRPGESEPIEDAPDESRLPLGEYYVTANAGLNLREVWNTDGVVLAVIPYGTKVEVLDWHDGWAYVQYGDVTGWCSGNYLSQNDPGPLPTEPAGEEPDDGVYTVEEVKQAIADANAIIASYKGRTPKNGRTSMTAAEVPEFYEDAVSVYDNWMWFCGQFDQQHEELKVSDGSYGFFLRVTDDKYKTIEDLCEKYYSYFSDDLACDALSGNVFILDGNMYAFAAGAGAEGVYHSHYHEVSEVAGGFEITTHITECRYPNGWDAEPEYSELVTTNMCILEDGVWVFDDVDIIYT